MNKYKIEVANEAESKEVQELFFELGYGWKSGKIIQSIDKPYLFACQDRTIVYASKSDGDIFKEHTHQKITLPELRILALLKRNDVNDANHEDAEGNKWFYKCRQYWLFNNASKEWVEVDEKEGDLHLLIYTPKKEKDMSNLISGKEAKLAWANGQDVQVKDMFSNVWRLINGEQHLKIFDSECLDFRLKPQTITVTLELPKPFKPELWDKYWFVSPYCSKGYSGVTFVNNSSDKILTQFGAYRTEEEVKQAVEALRTLGAT